VTAGDTAKVPLTACVPVQLPDAVHEVVFTLDHSNVALSPSVIEVGLAVRVVVVVPAGTTVRSAVAAADPAAFWQVTV
jgi:hypothetical protein